METVKVKVRDLYNLRALLQGLVVVKQGEKEGDKPVQEVLVDGFLIQAGINEGTKRQARRAVVVLNDQIKPIDEQRKEIAEFKEEGLDEAALKAKIIAKDIELLDGEIEINVEKIDFHRIENLSFREDYSFLYDKLFK